MYKEHYWLEGGDCVFIQNALMGNEPGHTIQAPTIRSVVRKLIDDIQKERRTLRDLEGWYGDKVNTVHIPVVGASCKSRMRKGACQCEKLCILTWWLHLPLLCDLPFSFWPLF